MIIDAEPPTPEGRWGHCPHGQKVVAPSRPTGILCQFLKLKWVNFCTYTVGCRKCKFYFQDNFGKYGPILIILSPLQSVMNCGVWWHKISHLLKSVAALPCKILMFKYTPIQQLFNSKVAQNPLLTVNIYERPTNHHTHRKRFRMT